jgi:hypothetical protein
MLAVLFLCLCTLAIVGRNNRKKGTDTITELTANGNDYKGEENVVKAFQDHFRKLVHTFNFGFALKIALFDEEVIAADFMISQILRIFSPIGI